MILRAPPLPDGLLWFSVFVARKPLDGTTVGSKSHPLRDQALICDMRTVSARWR